MKTLGLMLRWVSTGGRGSSVRNAAVVVRLLIVLVGMIVVYSIGFHWIMATEDQTYSWPTAVYWVLVTMSTLGFGDITFASDLGRLFSVVVLLSGAMFILVLLPFTYIQYIFLPRMEARALARAPRSLPDDMAGHVILTRTGTVEDALIRRLDRAGIASFVLVADLHEALALHDLGYSVMVGAPDDPATYVAARAANARLVAATGSDTANTNVTFTVREIAPTVDVLAVASANASVDILTLAGCNSVLQFAQMLGEGFAERVVRPDSDTHIIGALDDVLIAEASAMGTPLVGQRIGETRLRELVGVTVIALWRGGNFAIPDVDTVIEERSTLVLAGTAEQLAAYDDQFANNEAHAEAPVIIIGGGRVGRACGAHLAAAGYDYRIIEAKPERARDDGHYVVGDAANIDVLRAAGIDSTPAIVITTHDDDTNVYLSIYCRRLRPDAQVLARANVDRNVTTLHRAGADVVLSYASAGATAIWNRLQPDRVLLLAEGLMVFEAPVPPSMVGRTLGECDLRGRTGVNVVAVRSHGVSQTNPDPDRRLEAGDEFVLIGDTEAEQRFAAAIQP